MLLALRAVTLWGIHRDSKGTDPTASLLLTDLVAHPGTKNGIAWQLVDQIASQTRRGVAASCGPKLWAALYAPLASLTGEVEDRITFVLNQ